MMKDLEFLEHVIDQKSQMILDANDRIWEYAELAYHETRSADLLCQILKDEGFSVTTGDAGIPTCFTGTFSYGSGKPVMGILGEYDALSSLSQKAASPRKEPVEAGAPGQSRGTRIKSPVHLLKRWNYTRKVSVPLKGDRIPSFFAKEREYDAGTVF